jgi:glycine oxidase
LTCALLGAIARLGGVVAGDRRVDEVEVRGGRVAGVRGAGFLFEAERVILAAGAWSTRGIRSPLGRFGLRPVKGQLVRMTGERLLHRVVRTPRVYLIPRDDGELLLGATMEETGFDTSATAGAVLDLLRHGWEMLPGVYDLAFSEVSVGLRSATDDQLPVLGESEVPGLFLAFGHFRNGILLAPGTAELLAGWIDSGVAPRELEPFGPHRVTVRGARGVS